MNTTKRLTVAALTLALVLGSATSNAEGDVSHSTGNGHDHHFVWLKPVTKYGCEIAYKATIGAYQSDEPTTSKDAAQYEHDFLRYASCMINTPERHVVAAKTLSEFQNFYYAYRTAMNVCRDTTAWTIENQ